MTQDQIASAAESQIAFVKKLSRTLSQKWHCHFDDIFSVAQESLVKAVYSHDPSRGRLSTHVANIVNNDVTYFVRRERHHKKAKSISMFDLAKKEGMARADTIDQFESALSRSMSEFRLEDFLKGLSKDAELVVLMTVGMTEIIWDEELVPRKMRGRLRDFLKAQGWAHNRIFRTFSEIMDHLAGKEMIIRKG